MRQKQNSSHSNFLMWYSVGPSGGENKQNYLDFLSSSKFSWVFLQLDRNM